MELDYHTVPYLGLKAGEVGDEFHRQGTEAYIKGWKKLLIPVLKDSSSNERKFLRWRLTRLPEDLLMSEELEVFPETPL